MAFSLCTDANHLFVGNILNPETGDPVYNLNLASPWYSYSFQDLIDPSKRDPYGTSGNTFLGEWQTSRTLGRRYYEMTDHLGNVLATVLDRKTGVGTHTYPGPPSFVGYDHWVADLASTADYYPGGMMMPGRNTEYSWSRMAYNGKPKDDEVYGKGNFQDYGFRMLNTLINRFISEDPLTKQYPWYTPYQFAGNSPIEAIDLDGLEEYHTKDGNLLGKYGNNTEIRIVYDDYVKDAVSLFQMPTKDPNSDALNNALYNNHSAGVFKSADAAANDWAVRYNPQSIQNNQEYMSFIFSTVINNQRINSYTEPLGGTADESKATWSSFTKARLSGSIHSHGAYLPTYDNNNFSSFTNPDGTFGDIQSSDKLGTTDYLSTPNGSLKRYNTLGEKIINQNIPSDPSDPDRKNNIPPIAPAQKDVSSE